MNTYLAGILATGVVAVLVSSAIVLFVAGVLSLANLLPGDEDKE